MGNWISSLPCWNISLFDRGATLINEPHEPEPEPLPAPLPPPDDEYIPPTEEIAALHLEIDSLKQTLKSAQTEIKLLRQDIVLLQSGHDKIGLMKDEICVLQGDSNMIKSAVDTLSRRSTKEMEEIRKSIKELTESEGQLNKEPLPADVIERFISEQMTKNKVNIRGFPDIVEKKIYANAIYFACLYNSDKQALAKCQILNSL